MKYWFKIFKEFYEYAKKKKKYWLIPAILFMFILGFLIATAGTSQVPVFIYPLA